MIEYPNDFNKFVEFIKKELNIEFDIREDELPGNLRGLVYLDDIISGNPVIYFNKNFKYHSQFDMYFVPAHEGRHIWQIKNGKFFKDIYKKNDELSMQDYNEQEAEMDAHAFATAAMMKYAGIKPLFEMFENEYKEKIYQKADVIYKEMINKKKYKDKNSLSANELAVITGRSRNAIYKLAKKLGRLPTIEEIVNRPNHRPPKYK